MEWETNERITELRKYLGMSRDEFGATIGVSGSVIRNIDNKITKPKPLLLQQIAKIHHCNMQWLETGEGDMFLDTTADEEVAAFVGSVLADESAVFKRRLLHILSKLPEEMWEGLEQFARQLTEENEKDGEK